MFVRTRSTRSRTASRVFALAAVAAITLAACGDDDDDAPAAAATTVPAAAATTAAPAPTEAPATTANDRGLYGNSGATATTAAPAGAEGVVKVADSNLGKVLVAANGMTLYLFIPDAQGDPTCTAACAGAWPPLTVADGAQVSGGDGVDAALLATATNPEAGLHVTYNGWPLYYFSGDSAPGDTNGEGSGGVWYVVDPTGNPVDND
jgi:predicted lipoprotein with Yx(FWY)xxD motif